jgi:hypothetical protein
VACRATGDLRRCWKDALAAGAAAKAARGPDDSRAPGARNRSRHAESETFYSNARIGRRAESLNSDTNLAGRVGLGCTLQRLKGNPVCADFEVRRAPSEVELSGVVRES